MRTMGMGGSSRTLRPDIVSSIDQSLCIPVLDPSMMFCFQFCLSVLVCLLCFLEDVDQMLSLLGLVLLLIDWTCDLQCL
jgi:hypothetical protein